MSSLGCPVVAAVSAASGCQQPVFAQLRRGTHTPSGSYPIVKLRNPNDEKSSSGQIMKSFHALSFPRHAMPVRLGTIRASSLFLMKLINRVTLRFSLPCHSRVMKQILLRVATMCAEIICSEIRQHLSSHFASPGKIFFAQDSFDPNVNGECCDSLVGEQHDAIRHFHPHARGLAQLLPQLSVRERAPRIQIRFPGCDKLRRFQQVSRAIPEPAFS